MNYIVFKRFKGKAICGDVNLPALTEVELIDGTLYWQDKPLCVITSENAHKYYARNNDKNGMERGSLTQSITDLLAKRDEKYQKRWDKVWEDSICKKYKRREYEDFWLWNTAFFNAEIQDLKYIYKLIKEVE